MHEALVASERFLCYVFGTYFCWDTAKSLSTLVTRLCYLSCLNLQRWISAQDKQQEQKRSIEAIQKELEQARKDKATVEAHAEVLEKALMKMSMDNSKPPPQVQAIKSNL